MISKLEEKTLSYASEPLSLTLVGGLIFNKKRGGGFVADSEETTYAPAERKADIVDKIYPIFPEVKPTYFAGFSGAVPFITQTVEKTKEIIPTVKIDSKRHIEEVMRESYKIVRRHAFENGILERYGVNWEEFKRGNLDDRIMRKILEVAEKRESFGVAGIMGGKINPKEDFSLSYITYPGIVLPIENYASVGSGSDRFESTVSDYLHYMTSEERKDIPLTLGTRILIEGFKSSLRNAGVGTTGRNPGQMIISYDNNVIEIDRRRLNLLHNSIELEKRHLLDRTYVDKVIKDVIGRKEKPSTISKGLQEKLPCDKWNDILMDSMLS